VNRRHKLLWKAYGPFPLHVIAKKTMEIIEPEAIPS